MRAHEFINESEENNNKLPDSAIYAIPGARVWPDLDNSSPYHSFRFGVALAGSPDKIYPKDGPYGQKMVTLAYSEEDQVILDAVGKAMGFKSNELTTKGSDELPNGNTKSPIPQNSGKTIKRRS